MKNFVFCLLVAVCCAPSARASLVVTAPTSTTTGMLQVTAPITFTINSSDTLYAFVMDDWVTSADANKTSSTLSSALAFTLNGTATSASCTLYDNEAASFGALTPRDGTLYTGGIAAVAAGDKITLAAGSYALSMTANFNPGTTKTFTGNLFLIGADAVRISDIVSAVPEPSTWWLTGGGMLGFGLAARRRRWAGTVAG